MSVTFNIPLKTQNPLNGSHGHWAKLAKIRKSQRSVVELVTPHHVIFGDGPLVITLTRLAPSSGLDFDGLTAALKSVRDGVADGLGFDDDSDPRLEWRYAQKRAKGYSVSVEIAVKEAA